MLNGRENVPRRTFKIQTSKNIPKASRKIALRASVCEPQRYDIFNINHSTRSAYAWQSLNYIRSEMTVKFRRRRFLGKIQSESERETTNL